MASGSGPPRRSLSRPAILAISSGDSSKSKASMFSAMRLGLVDFGITEARARWATGHERRTGNSRMEIRMGLSMPSEVNDGSPMSSIW